MTLLYQHFGAIKITHCKILLGYIIINCHIENEKNIYTIFFLRKHDYQNRSLSEEFV